MVQLKDGTEASDPRLDRIVEFDEASRNYPITARLGAAPPKERIWRLDRAKMGDQGREGACVEFGITHELAAAPVYVPGYQLVQLRSGHLIYWPAQRDDQWPGGEYPGASPQYGGTSLLAGLKRGRALGYFDSFHWSFGMDEAVEGVLTVGPAVIAVTWLSSMFDPDENGLVRCSGNAEGGHCIAWIGVVKRQRFGTDRVAVLAQSWGLDYGDRGRIYIRLPELQERLEDDGECAFMSGRKIPKTLPSSWDE